uniref:protein adenylyltransferase n=1 Tax=Acrobeloides nanus TaxID=290746 RepID=A0A914D0I1_9BILA
MPDPNEPPRSSTSLLKIVLTCVVVSLGIQVGWPAFEARSISYICGTNLVPDEVKKIFHCNNIDEDKRKYTIRRGNPNEITFFAEPLQTEPWFSTEENVIRDNQLAKLPEQALSGRPEPWTEAEAVAALQAAKKSREIGNYRRAEIIIQHAYALAPQHPDVLTEYGIFVETVRKNVLEAEGLYLKALNYNPSHSEALTRRAKTLPLVEEIDNKMLKEIERKRERFLKIPRSNPAMRRAMKENYFQHVYHTVALEGNTMSLYQTRSILESRMAISGKSIIEHNEILGMDAALRFLNQSLAHVGRLTIQNILAIHKRVLGFVDPIAAGVFRSTQVFVGSFSPVPAEYVQSEMEEFMSWLNDEETLSIDPVELAALAHYKL